jgi:hypothetical protein
LRLCPPPDSFLPIRLSGLRPLAQQVGTRDMVMVANFGAAHSGEEFLSAVRVDAVSTVLFALPCMWVPVSQHSAALGLNQNGDDEVPPQTSEGSVGLARLGPIGPVTHH